MIVLELDKPREWRMDLDAFDRVCDGFAQMGMEEFAENPLSSLDVLAVKKDENGKPLESFKLNKRTLGVMRVWTWAGLTDPMMLKEFSSLVSLKALPGLVSKVLPGITEAILGPQEPEAQQDAGVPGDGGRSDASASA